MLTGTSIGHVVQVAVMRRHFHVCRNKIKMVMQFYTIQNYRTDTETGNMTCDKSVFCSCHHQTKPRARPGVVENSDLLETTYSALSTVDDRK